MVQGARSPLTLGVTSKVNPVCALNLDRSARLRNELSWERCSQPTVRQEWEGLRISTRRSEQYVCKRLDDTSGRRTSARTLPSCDASVKRNPKRLKYNSSHEKATDTLYVQVKPDGSDAWRLDAIADKIRDGAIGVIPTDTIYAFVCDLRNKNAVERLYRIKEMDAKKPLSILCRSFQDIDTYTLGFPRGNGHGQTNVFRAIRQCLPGPFTFILKASKEMPKQCTTFGGSAVANCAPRKSVGVRMPNDPICLALLSRLDRPLLCTSVRQMVAENWIIDPAIISDTYGGDGGEGVDFVVDGGVRVAEPSTVVDMTADRPVLLRRGKGEVEEWMMLEPSEDSSLALAGGRINPYAT